MMKKSIVLLFSIFLILFAGCDLLSKSQQPEVNPKTGTNIGDLAPDIIQKSPDGEDLQLSDLRGKYVLVDFWASWCGPCRKENPVLVDAYAKYSKAKFKKAKGFEIYSVSLDRNKKAWIAAIEKDALTWENHVSDLKYWKSEAAQVYGVRSIPMNYLLDPNGVIIAKNLRGQRLHKAVDKYVKAFK